MRTRSAWSRCGPHGKESEVLEESLRRDLGVDFLNRLWATNKLDEGEAMKLAVEAQRRTRPRRLK
jgi:hypothetical protein